MSVVAMIKNIKQIHKKDIVFIKSGKFYYCYGRDSYIISYFSDYSTKLLPQWSKVRVCNVNK